MPFFAFICPEDDCHETAGEWRAKWTSDRPTCAVHDKEMERDWHAEARRHRPGSSFPFVTKNISGKPIEVRDQGHLNQLCKEYGVEQRNDAAWLEPVYEKYDMGRFNWRTLQWEGQRMIRQEGSGRGMPGCW